MKPKPPQPVEMQVEKAKKEELKPKPPQPVEMEVKKKRKRKSLNRNLKVKEYFLKTSKSLEVHTLGEAKWMNPIWEIDI